MMEPKEERPLMTEQEILDFAAKFVGAIQSGDVATVRACYAPDAKLWHNTDNIEQTVRQTGDFEVQVTFNEAYAPTLIQNLFTATIASVLDSKLVLQNAGEDRGNTWLNRNSAGSGAFRLTRYQPNESYTLDRNDGWWRGRANMQRVIVRHVPEAATQRLLLERGDVDVARNLTPTDIAALRGRPGISIQEFPRGTIQYFSANLADPILSNPRVIEALKHLVDYDAIANNLLPGQVFPHQSFIPRAILGEVNERPWRFDPTRARALLAEAGHPNGIRLTMDTANTFPSLDVAQALQASFARGGVTLEVLPATGAQVLAKFRARNHQLFIGIWGLGYPDPHYNADGFAHNPPGANNPGKLTWRNNWNIPELTARTEAAMRERDQNARAAILRLFEREAEEISSDGAHLWVYRDGDAMPDEHEVAQLEKLRAALAAVPAANLDLLHDRFFWRALLVESIAWSLAIYGVAARGVPSGYF
jgi:peptide/nickel transport system substrate-binding protein